MDLVVWCIDENSASYPVFLWNFDPEGHNFTQPFASSVIYPELNDSLTRYIMIETSSFIIRETWINTAYQQNLVLVGNRIPLNKPEFENFNEESHGTLEDSLTYTFRELHIQYCPLYTQLWNVTDLQKCILPVIEWSEVTFLGIEEMWSGFTFRAQSAALGDMNGDEKVDIVIYGSLYHNNGRFFASILLILENRDMHKSVPIILVAREYHLGGDVFDSNNEKVLTGCTCEGPDCLVHLSVVLGDFDNDMDLDVILFDNIRGERECTIATLMLNDGNANLVHFSDIVVPPLTQRNHGELVPSTMSYSVGSWPRSRPSVIVVDYNNDGALDLLIEISGHVIIFESSLYSVNGVAKANWVDVFVVSTSETPGAIGKIVKLKTKSGMKIFREVYGNSRGSARLHFGLGSNKVAENLKVLTDVDHVGIYGYRNIEGGQTLYLADILRVEYKNKAALELISSNPIRLDECGESNKVRLEPEFMIIGFWKCGTTGLHEYLTEHPQILAPNVKELIYFSIWQNMYPSTLNTYKAQFPCGVKDYHLTFESTPSYVVVPYVAARLRNTFPELKKFILCVRDPIDRAYSYFQMMTRTETAKLWVLYLHMECVLSKSKDKNFQNAFKKNVCHNQHTYDPKTTEFPFMFDVIIRAQLFMLEHCLNANGDDMDAAIFECPSLNSQILTSSLYYYHYSHWLKFYPKESFLIVNYADLLDHYKFPPTMLKIVKFLSIEPHTWEPPPPSVVSKYSSMWESTRKLLRNFFYEHNKKFYKLAGVDYGW
eukprot:TRINITY_DN1052_c0_g1_i1.p1 TRINITY_DN1052_c0_g1~~TRINITY_DN1052_c0_g1_i1.p1  ORF type:complete len:770 (+),score=116.28 TRINITY_DN1052_c0_g1_i1:936-3245(+)